MKHKAIIMWLGKDNINLMIKQKTKKFKIKSLTYEGFLFTKSKKKKKK